MNNKTYTAITIGPIIETMSKAQKTRELWAASYFFSYLMREITKKLKVAEFEILIPGLDEINNINLLGAGLYHDRIIISSAKPEDAIISSVKRIMNSVLEDTAGKIYDDFEKLKEQKIGKEYSSISKNNFQKE
jgi:CRISPR-associated protein Cmr2